MASPEKVKRYLAYWFQLGKKLILNDTQEITMSDSVIKGDRYSEEFEACWQNIIDREGKNYYLEGTEPSIEELLLSQWNIRSCARCSMPIPKQELGSQTLDCPCVDLPSWPNFELPLPRAPIDSNSRIKNIASRLTSKNTNEI
jgi:hypothetical protein